MKSRITQLQSELKKKGLLPYLITDLKNIQYLTGFAGSYARLIVDQKAAYFISDPRYEEYAKGILSKPFVFVLQKESLHTVVASLLRSIERNMLYLEEHALVLSDYLEYKKKFRGIKLMPGGDEVNSIRMIKDAGEIALLRKAAHITDQCFEYLKRIIKPGIIEWEIALEVEMFYRRNGCKKTSFDTIIASGKGSSMPHYQTSIDKTIKKGDIVLIDMGCEYQGYNSDLTRTVFVHTISPLFERVYSIVQEAQQAACDAVKHGVATKKLDSIARRIISEQGYGGNFGHSLGHGIGIEVHELPAVKDNDIILKKNMTVTIEPGIYLPGSGGVRIEDMVLVTGSGHEILTKASKDIIVL